MKGYNFQVNYGEEPSNSQELPQVDWTKSSLLKLKSSGSDKKWPSQQ